MNSKRQTTIPAIVFKMVLLYLQKWKAICQLGGPNGNDAKQQQDNQNEVLRYFSHVLKENHLHQYFSEQSAQHWFDPESIWHDDDNDNDNDEYDNDNDNDNNDSEVKQAPLSPLGPSKSSSLSGLSGHSGPSDITMGSRGSVGPSGSSIPSVPYVSSKMLMTQAATILNKLAHDYQLQHGRSMTASELRNTEQKVRDSMIRSLVKKGLERRSHWNLIDLWSSLPLQVKTLITQHLASHYASTGGTSDFPLDEASAIATGSEWNTIFQKARTCTLELVLAYLNTYIVPQNNQVLHCLITMAALKVVISIYGLDEACLSEPNLSFWFEPIKHLLGTASTRAIQSANNQVNKIIIQMLKPDFPVAPCLKLTKRMQ